MLEVEPTCQHGRTATGNGRNGRRISFRRHRGDILLLSRTTYKCSVLKQYTQYRVHRLAAKSTRILQVAVKR